jgi:hypothetical protein
VLVTSGIDRRLLRDRTGKILALGLVWGIAVLALLSERLGSKPARVRAAQTPAPIAPRARSPELK